MKALGQASTEYLVVISVGIIIALVGVAVLGGFIELGSGVSDKQSKLYWRGAEIGILDWIISDSGEVTLQVRNNAAGAVTLTKVTVDGQNININPTNLKTGESKTITGTTTGGAGKYSKNVEIEYTSGKYNLAKTLAGQQPIVGVYTTAGGGGGSSASTTTTAQATTTTTTSTTSTSTTSTSTITTSLPQGLVAWWKLDETSGTTAADSSTYGNDGTVSGGEWLNGVAGNSLYLAAGDHVKQQSGANADIEGNISLSMWIRSDGLSGGRDTPIHKDSQYTLALGSGYTISWADSSLWEYNTFGWHDVGFEPGTWQHLAVTKNNSVVKVYNNGVEKVSNTFGGPITSTNNIMFLGCYANSASCGSNYFAGRLDEVKLWNKVLTPQEVTAEATANTPERLRLHYNLNEGAGTTASDSSTYGNDGAINGAAWTTGVEGSALEFNGAGDKIKLASPRNANVGGDITFTAWIKPQSSTALRRVIVHKNGQYSLAIQANNQVTWADSSDWDYTHFGYHDIGLQNGVWQHIAVTKEGSTVRIYRNGVEEYSKTFGGMIWPANSITHLGCYAENGNCLSNYYYKGGMDEVEIWEKALTPQEIQAEYDATKPPELVLHLKFDEAAGAATAIDSSTYGNDGTISGATSGASGVDGTSYSFDGTNDYITLGDFMDSSNSGDEITITLWLKRDTVGSYVDIINKYGDYPGGREENGWLLRYTPDNKIGFVLALGSYNYPTYTTNDAFTDTSRYHHIAVTHKMGDATSTRSYYDGNEVAGSWPSGRGGEIPTNGPTPIRIGLQWWANQVYYPVDGLIDDVKIYNRVLTPAEIQTEYNTYTPP